MFPLLANFSLTLSEVYSPCNKCDVCAVMQYPESSGYLDHFLSRVGVPQVREALMRCQVWTNDYLTKILHRTETRVRVAERVYSSQPAIPKPTHYAQALFGSCKIPSVMGHVDKVGLNFTEAMRIIGSVCWYNCEFCCSPESCVL